MKAFIATAFALCYFLQDGVEGGYQVDFEWGNKRQACLTKLGYTPNGPKDLKKVKFAFEFLTNAFAQFVGYNSVKLDQVFGVIGWRNNALNAAEKKNLRKVLGKKNVNRRLQALTLLIKDVRNQFENAVQNNQAEYASVWSCIKSNDQGQANQQQNQTYLRLTQKGANCAEKIIGKAPTEKLDEALHHYDIDLKFVKQGFGSNDVERLLQSLNISNCQEVLDRVLNNFQNNKLFQPQEVRLGTYILPGQSNYVIGLLSRLAIAVRNAASKVKAANNNNGNGNKGKRNNGNGNRKNNQRKPNKAAARQLVRCILKK